MWSIRGETIYTQLQCNLLTQCQFLKTEREREREREREGGGGGGVNKCKIKAMQKLQNFSKVCTISFEQPVNYLCDAWHVSHPSMKRGLILLGLELNTNARELFEHCWSYSLNLSIYQDVCYFASWHLHCKCFHSGPFPSLLSVIWNNQIAAVYHCPFLLGKFGRSFGSESVPLRCC